MFSLATTKPHSCAKVNQKENRRKNSCQRNNESAAGNKKSPPDDCSRAQANKTLFQRTCVPTEHKTANAMVISTRAINDFFVRSTSSWVLVVAVALWAHGATASVCDIINAAPENTTCVAAHSLVRALYSSYNGPLYQVRLSALSAVWRCDGADGENLLNFHNVGGGAGSANFRQSYTRRECFGAGRICGLCSAR